MCSVTLLINPMFPQICFTRKVSQFKWMIKNKQTKSVQDAFKQSLKYSITVLLCVMKQPRFLTFKVESTAYPLIRLIAYYTVLPVL